MPGGKLILRFLCYLLFKSVWVLLIRRLQMGSGAKPARAYVRSRLDLAYFFARGARRAWSSASLTGFERNWFMPTSRHFACSSGSAAAVSAMIVRRDAAWRAGSVSVAQARMRRV